jgi:hypothetical protein
VNEATLQRQVHDLLETLRREFADDVPASRVTAVGAAYFDGLRAEARIPDFIPVLVYRYTREELLRVTRDDLHHAA